MSHLTEIKTKLDALGSLGPLTIGFMPASPDVVGTIYSYAGRMPERGFGVVGIKYDKPSIQVVFRGIPFDYLGPEAKVLIVRDTLISVQPGALGAGITTEYLEIDPQQSPFQTQSMDANNRFYVGCNFYISKVPS